MTEHPYQTRSRSSTSPTQTPTQSPTQSPTQTPTQTPTQSHTPISLPVHAPNNAFRLPQFTRYIQILAFSATCVLLHNLLNVHYVRQCGLWFFESAYCRIVNRVLTLLQTSPLLIIGVLFQDAERG